MNKTREGTNGKKKDANGEKKLKNIILEVWRQKIEKVEQSALKPVSHIPHHTKSTFSSPIRATPAADPITSRDPPVPAQKAMSCHRGESMGRVATGYIPVSAIHSILL